MKLPNKIATLTELTKWIKEENPYILEISKKSKLLEIWEFGRKERRWEIFHDIPIKYLKEKKKGFKWTGFVKPKVSLPVRYIFPFKKMSKFAKKYYKGRIYKLIVNTKDRRRITMKFDVSELVKNGIEPLDITLGLKGFFSDNKKRDWLKDKFKKYKIYE